MKGKLTKEEEKEREQKQVKAEEQTLEIIAEAIMTSIDIQAQEKTLRGLGLSVGELKEKKPAVETLGSPYQDWNVSFLAQPSNSGLFRIKCSTAELRREITLNRDNLEQLFKTLLEQPEVLRFSTAIREGMKHIESNFNEVFEQNIKSIAESASPDKFAQVIRLLANQTARVLKKDMAMREGLYHMRKPQDLIPFERKLFGKLPGEDTVESLEKGLRH